MHFKSVKCQRERQIKVQVQSELSISLFFFSNFYSFSHSVACEIGPRYCWMREKGFLWLLLFDDSSGFCYPSTDVPFWYSETDHLISGPSTLSTSHTELSGIISTINENFISVYSQYDTRLAQKKKEEWLEQIKLEELSSENIREWMRSSFAAYPWIQEHNCLMFF